MNALAAYKRSPAQRGRPLVSLLCVLGLWCVIRLFLWQSPLEPVVMQALPPAFLGDIEQPEDARGTPDMPASDEASDAPDWYPAPVEPALERPVAGVNLMSGGTGAQMLAPARGGGASPRAMSPRLAVDHALLLAAGMTDMQVPPALLAYREQGLGLAAAPVEGERSPVAGRAQPIYAPWLIAEEHKRAEAPRRWGADGWALVRRGSAGPASLAQPSYGRSQIGAVVHYRLDPESKYRPRAHLRASAALDGAREREAALGVSARPLPQVPVRVYAELRASDTAQGTEARAAAFAVSEFPPLDLPAGMQGEAYLQSGYVTGDFATAFVDGQARITRDVTSHEDFRLTAGGGAWGGAQDGAERVDIGPSAGVHFKLGETQARVTADYRVRIAGNAAPASGPAVTIAAGF